MPSQICIMASVMMKEGMPMRVTPKAVTPPRARQVATARMMAKPPAKGILAMLTLASCRVKKATTMPVALATLATLKSISAVRITKVSPTAMMPVIDTCCRMFCRLPNDTKEGLAIEKKTTRKSSVRKGAILLSWFRNQWLADCRCAFTSDVEVINWSLSHSLDLTPQRAGDPC